MDDKISIDSVLQSNEFGSLLVSLMFSFMQPIGNKPQISEEKLAKGRELAKLAKSKMESGEKYEIKEGDELYEDTELFNAYCQELAKILTIDNINKEASKIAELKKLNIL